MRKPMEPVMAGTKLIKFGFDREGNEIAWYAGDFDDEEERAATVAEETTITAKHITDTINKMMKCGKQLPQTSRIRSAKNPDAEREVVLAETIEMWCEIFFKQHIGVEMWERATDRALIINGIPRLDVQIISPPLMYAALQECQKEFMQEQQTSYGREKEEQKAHGFAPADFPEMGQLIAYHMAKHKKPLLPLPAPETIRAWAMKSGWHENAIEKNMLKLRVYYCFGQHANRDKAKMPIKLVTNSNGLVSIQFVK